jgi:nucleoside-diphosphate-sugar epimerase
MEVSSVRGKGMVVAGVTGFLGRRTLKRLLVDGDKVIVLIRGNVRHGKSADAQQRLTSLLASLNCSAHAQSVAAIDMDISAIDVTLLGSQLRQACQALDVKDLTAINFAASLKMDFPGQSETGAERIRSQNQRTNVEGLKNLTAAIGLAEKLSGNQIQLQHFVQFGTAYAHGQATGLLLEESIALEIGTNNSYERSKRLGEHHLEQWHAPRASRTRLSIIRPSIVTGPDTPDGLGAWLNILSEPVRTSSMPKWLQRFFRLEQDRHRLIDVVRAIARRLPIPVPMLGNRDGVLDLIDVGDVDRYSYRVIRDARPASAFPVPLYLHLSNPLSGTLREVSISVLGAAGCADIAGRLRVFRGFNLFTALLSIFSVLPFSGAAVGNLFKRTQMLRPYLMRPSQTRFDTTRTRDYFRGLDCEYQVRRIDTEYLAELLLQKRIPLAPLPVEADDGSESVTVAS